MEEQIIDATTEEGQKQLKEIEASNKAAEQAAVAEKYDDPE